MTADEVIRLAETWHLRIQAGEASGGGEPGRRSAGAASITIRFPAGTVNDATEGVKVPVDSVLDALTEATGELAAIESIRARIAEKDIS